MELNFEGWSLICWCARLRRVACRGKAAS